jgi:hypothetical protein
MITCQWLFLVVVLILLTKAFLNYNWQKNQQILQHNIIIEMKFVFWIFLAFHHKLYLKLWQQRIILITSWCFIYFKLFYCHKIFFNSIRITYKSLRLWTFMKTI